MLSLIIIYDPRFTEIILLLFFLLLSTFFLLFSPNLVITFCCIIPFVLCFLIIKKNFNYLYQLVKDNLWDNFELSFIESINLIFIVLSVSFLSLLFIQIIYQVFF